MGENGSLKQKKTQTRLKGKASQISALAEKKQMYTV